MAVRRLRTEDDGTNRTSLSMRDDAARALACPLLAGRRLDGIVIASAGTATVSHGLRRAPVGVLLDVMKGPGQSCPIVSATDDATITFSNPGATAISFAVWVY